MSHHIDQSQDTSADEMELHHSVADNSPTLQTTSILSTRSRRPSLPAVEIKLFVGRIPRTYSEQEVRMIFVQFGIVRDVIVIRDRESGVHKGCAFVRMASITEADLAIRSLNNAKILEPNLGPIQVKYAFGEHERLGLTLENGHPGTDQVKLFVGSLPKEKLTEADVEAVFKRFGAVDEVYILRDEKKNSKGCAFVRLAFKEEAFHAIANLNGKFTMPGGIRAMEVRFAESRRNQQEQRAYSRIDTAYMGSPTATVFGPVDVSGWMLYHTAEGRPYYYNIHTRVTQWEHPRAMPKPETYAAPSDIVPGGIGAQTHGPPGANVFVFHVPNAWEERDLVAHFCQFGKIVSARVASDKGSGRRLGFGFVSFAEVESAVAAVEALNGLNVGGKRLKVTIKRGEERYAEACQQVQQQHGVNQYIQEEAAQQAIIGRSPVDTQQMRSGRNNGQLGNMEDNRAPVLANSPLPQQVARQPYKPEEYMHEWHAASGHIGERVPQTIQVQPAPAIYGIVGRQQPAFTFNSRHLRFAGPAPTAAH